MDGGDSVPRPLRDVPGCCLAAVAATAAQRRSFKASDEAGSHTADASTQGFACRKANPTTAMIAASSG